MSQSSDDHSLPTSENGGEHAAQRRQPALVPSQFGSRWVSVAALVEQIESAFIEEHGDGSEALAAAHTAAQRLKLVLETANYIFSVESVQLTADEKADIIKQSYSSLFGYGPLDDWFADQRVTTISLEGSERAAVRYGHAELESIGRIFESPEQYQRIIHRLVTDAGAELRPEHPYMEFGLQVGGRLVCLNLVTPPVTLQVNADIRLHPPQVPTWESLLSSAYLSEQGLQLVRALAASPHGLLIIGEPESGKTTLLNRIVNDLSHPEQIVSVERAGEMRLPAEVRRLTAQWPTANQPGVSFGEQIQHALDLQPACLVLDEVRADEPQTIAPLLQMGNAPRLIWSFRGATFAKRLQSALGMLARRAEVGGGEVLIRPLYERLPFVIAVNRVGDQLRLWGIGEWQFKHSTDYPTYTPIMQVDNGTLRLTGEQPLRELPLPDSFWRSA